MRAPGPSDDKYRRGVLSLRTGSSAYPGAAVLGVEAAWRTGVGLLRYEPPIDDLPPRFELLSPAAAVLAARPETVFGVDPAGRTDAWLIGSGTDPARSSAAEAAALREVLTGAAPVVVDAGALRLAVEIRGFAIGRAASAADRSLFRRGDARRGSATTAGAGPFGPPLILTPHAGEFATLWSDLDLGPLPGDATAPVPATHADRPAAPRADRPTAPRLTERLSARADAAAALAARVRATVLLKGSVTLVATPDGQVLASGPATPWLATAGTGDVLAGILGALVASRAAEIREDPELLGPLGATAALLHDVAARTAAGDDSVVAGHTPSSHALAESPDPGVAAPSGRPITALDVAHALPQAVASLLALAPPSQP
nr:ADP/ATP-dependent (S)-NAD(P)H-hydrate dehydratase [Leucobacter edaphi]